MKLIYKSRFSILLALLSVLLFTTSCEDKFSQEPAPAYNTNSANVYFSSTNSSSIVLGLEATSFDIVVKREKTTSAQTVKLTPENSNGEIFTIPTEVSFAVGESQKNVTITVADMELMKSYHLAIQIDGNDTKPYVAQTVYPRIEINVLKEDFAPYANGTYSDYFFAPGDDYIDWPITLEYSPMTTTYRLKDVWVEGYNVTFKWDKAANVTMIGTTSGAYKVIPTGYVHPTYGMVSAYYGACSYNTNTKKFTFPITWRVSAGSFGTFADYYTITNLL